MNFILKHSTLIVCILFLSFGLCGSESPVNKPHKNIFRGSISSESTTADNVIVSSTEPTMFQKIQQFESSKSANNKKTTTEKYVTLKKMNLIQKEKVKEVAKSVSDAIVNTYRVNNTEDGTTCILMTVDALITFNYITKLNEKEEGDTFVPSSDKASFSLSGDCSNSDKSSMSLKWKSFELNFDFGKAPGGEKWFVNRMQLSFNTKESVFKHINHPNTFVQAETVEGDLSFITPVGQSFKCHRELEKNLYDSRFPDIEVKLLLRELTLEPFIFKNNDFGPEYWCPAPGVGSFRSETAPFVFGSLLTIASLFTIAGYAVYRYLKVNKVQYDTME